MHRKALLVAVVLAGATPSRADTIARLVPPSEGPDVVTLGVEPDGTRRIVAYGLRALVHPDGAMEVSEEVLPSARGIQALELPARFGRGFLFSVVLSNRTAIWRARSFTGKLTPFAQLDVDAERWVAGFDRIYIQARRTGDYVAIDGETGRGLDRGSLPASPSFGALAFADGWFGAAELPIRGVVATFDAGGSWYPLGRGVQLLGVTGSALLLATPNGRRLLAADGSVRPDESGANPPPDEDAPGARRVSPEGPLGSAPLATALLRGFPDGNDHAIVAAGGALNRVRLSDGRVVQTRERVIADANDCTGFRLGAGYGFFCREPSGKARLYAFRPPLGLELVQAYDGPRSLFVSGNGGLVLRGGCGTSARAASEATYCVRPPAGEPFEIAAHAPLGTERVIALRDGSAARLLPPVRGKGGSLTLVTPGGVERKVPLVIDARDEATKTLLARGFWLDGMVERDDGKIAGWVSGQGVFAGVRIALDGRVRAGPPRRGIERAMLSGSRALVLMSAGIAEQTVDGGASYTDVDLPSELELDPAKLVRAAGPIEQGCSALGCVFGGWLRVGWDGPSGNRPLPIADVPPPTALPQPGGGRWILRCSPTGEVSAPALATTPAPNLAEGQPPWLGLYEQPGPNRARDAVGFDTGGEGDLRAYAWAPRGADFGKAGRFQVSVLDAYRVRGGVWTSLPSPSPWSDENQVGEVFGYEGSAPSAWHLNLDSGGRAGVLTVAARGTTELFAVEEGRTILPLVNGSRQGVGTVTSAVRLGTTFYVAAQEEQRGLRVFALENGDARLIGQYADLPQGRGVSPVLVRSARGDALAIWTRGAGWYVFPIDLRTGAVASAIEIRAAELARLPRACATDEEGYVLEGAVGIEPYAEFLDGSERVSAHGFEGRFTVSERGICVSALSAQSDGAMDRRLRPHLGEAAKRATVPLVIQDRSDGGRRWGFRCGD